MRRKELSWQLGFSLSRKPAKKPRSKARRNNWGATNDVWENADGSQQFEFVVEHPLGDHGSGPICPSVITASSPNEFSLLLTDYPKTGDSVNLPTSRTRLPVEPSGEEPIQRSFETPLLASNEKLLVRSNDSPASQSASVTAGSPPPLGYGDYEWRYYDSSISIFQEGTLGLGIPFNGSYQVASIARSPTALSSSLAVPDFSDIPPGVLYNNLCQRFEPILNRCRFMTRIPFLLLLKILTAFRQ